MAKYKARYGLSAGAVCTLYESCWRGKDLNRGCGWANFDAFARWAAGTGYVKHAHLRRVRADKPYGPDNAFWDFPESVKPEYPDGHPARSVTKRKDAQRRVIPGCNTGMTAWRISGAYWGRIAMTDISRSSRQNPCMGCPDRYTACSDHCKKPEFLGYKAEQKKINENRRKYWSQIWKHGEGRYR